MREDTLRTCFRYLPWSYAIERSSKRETAEVPQGGDDFRFGKQERHSHSLDAICFIIRSGTTANDCSWGLFGQAEWESRQAHAGQIRRGSPFGVFICTPLRG